MKMYLNNHPFIIIGIILKQVCCNVAMSSITDGVDLGVLGSNSHSNAGHRRARSNIRPTRKMTKESHPLLASIYGTAQNVRVWSGQKPIKAPNKGVYGKSTPERTTYNQKSESLSLSEELCNLCSRANDLDCVMRHCFSTVPTNIKLKTADLLLEKIDNHTPNKPETKLTNFQVGKIALENFEKGQNCKDPISVGHARRCKRQATLDTYEPAIDPKDRITMLQIHQENERKQLFAQQNHMNEMQRQLRLAEAIQQEQIKEQQIAHALYNKKIQDHIMLANNQHQRQLEMQAELELAEEIRNKRVKLQQMQDSPQSTQNIPTAHTPSKQTSYIMNQDFIQDDLNRNNQIQTDTNLDTNQQLIPGVPKLIENKPIQQTAEYLTPVQTIGKHLFDLTQRQHINEQQIQLELAKQTQQEQVQEQLLTQQRQQQHQQRLLDSAIQQQRDQFMQQQITERQQQQEQLLQQEQQSQLNLQQSKRYQTKLKNQQKNKNNKVKKRRQNEKTKRQRQLARQRRIRRMNQRRIKKLNNKGMFEQNKKQGV